MFDSFSFSDKYANISIKDFFEELDTNQEGDSIGKLDQAEIAAAKTKYSDLSSIWNKLGTDSNLSIEQFTGKLNCNTTDMLGDLLRGDKGQFGTVEGNEITDNDIAMQTSAIREQQNALGITDENKRKPMGV